MLRPLRDTMEAMLEGWRDDLPPAWRGIAGSAQLGFGEMDPGLALDPWEPVFPVRRGRVFPSQPPGAHMLRAFDGIVPQEVRCVILGQDPYPCPAFSTGRAFEAGNVASWRELDKMFSVSVRIFIQMIVAARTGDGDRARSVADWPKLRDDLDSGRLAFEPPAELADRWVRSGVLLLNSSLTLSRFKVEVDAHQSHGHLPLWHPFIVAVLRQLVELRRPIVFIGFGDAAAAALDHAGIAEGEDNIRREHPARGDRVLALPNPFLLCNRRLAALDAAPVDW
ncbi:Uracil-DNA glycosylase [Rhizobiales bacterium GAS113]|nr:Uracil-DNA glycosylase [Rhizobiales bacterium GAS113]